MSTFNAPPDQINGLTMNGDDTLNVGNVTVSGIVDNGGVIIVNGGTANGTTVNAGTFNLHSGTASGTTVGGTFNVSDSTISGTTVAEFGTLNLNGGTAVNTVLDGGALNNSGGIIDGIKFVEADDNEQYSVSLTDLNSLQGTLGFVIDDQTTMSISLSFENVQISKVTVSTEPNTITIFYGQNQSVTYNYTVNLSAAVDSVLLVPSPSGSKLEIDLLGTGPDKAGPPFSSQSAAAIVYTAEFGSAPDATELNVLNQFAQAQFDFGQKIGVMDPSIYAFQALGVALASATHFQDTFGPTNVLYPVSTVGDVHFIDDSYASVFGHAGTAAQIQQFVDQVSIPRQSRGL